MASASLQIPNRDRFLEITSWALELLLWPLHFLMAAPVLLFLGALTAMLLRHPDVSF